MMTVIDLCDDDCCWMEVMRPYVSCGICTLSIVYLYGEMDCSEIRRSRETEIITKAVGASHAKSGSVSLYDQSSI